MRVYMYFACIVQLAGKSRLKLIKDANHNPQVIIIIVIIGFLFLANNRKIVANENPNNNNIKNLSSKWKCIVERNEKTKSDLITYEKTL